MYVCMYVCTWINNVYVGITFMGMVGDFGGLSRFMHLSIYEN